MSETADWRPFSEVIKDFRERHNLTLDELSRMVGIPAQTLNRYELGQRAPKVSVVQEMAFKLGVNPMWFMGYDKDDEFNASDTRDLPPNKISNFGVYYLSENEKDLILRFRKLTPEGQEKLLAYATDLTSIPMYIDPKEYDRVLNRP